MPKPRSHSHDEKPWVYHHGPLTDDNIGSITARLAAPPDEALLAWCREQPGIMVAAQSASDKHVLNIRTKWPERGADTRAEKFIKALEERLGYTLDRSGPQPPPHSQWRNGLSLGI